MSDLPQYTAARAAATTTTWDANTRQLQVIWSTGARGINYISGIGRITEELDLSANAVRLDILNSGQAPVLNGHDDWGGATAVIGRVISASVDGSRGIATLEISAADDVAPIRQRLDDGTLRNVSVGYRIYRYDQAIEGDATIFRAVDWQPYEISLVAVPLDAGAGVRGHGPRPTPAIENPTEETTMTSQTPNPAPVPAPAPDPAALEAARAAGRAEAAAHIAAIDGVLTAARGMLPEERLTALRADALANNQTPEAFRAALFDAAAEAHRSAANRTVPAQPTSGAGGANPIEGIIDAMADAIAIRCLPGYAPATERHREYAGWRPSDFASELLTQRGERGVPRAGVALAARAFSTTADFPQLLAAAANKMLLAAYQLQNPTYRRFMAPKVFSDFKEHRFLRAGDFPVLEQLNESGEIKAGSMSEARESVYLNTFAKRVRITRQVIVNDDLGAFADFTGLIGRRVADFENAQAMSVLNTASGVGPNLRDGNPVFHSSRANVAGAGTAIDVANVGAGRAAMLKQAGLDGIKLNLPPAILLCGPDRLLAAQQLLAPIAATQASNVNPFPGSLVPIADANITGNKWWLFADPAAAPVYIYGYLNGANGPMITSGPVQGIDGFEISVLLDFACGAVGGQGGWFNAGA